MAYETKVILSLLAQYVSKAQTLEEAYDAIVKAASVEGLKLPSYTEARQEVEAKTANPTQN